jgi:L-fucose isomerase-like protein
MAAANMDRREFMGLTTASIAGGVLGLSSPSPAAPEPDVWDPDRPLVTTGKPLVLQPLLMYRVSQREQASSWKSWGGVQTENAATREAAEIAGQLSSLADRAAFPIQIRPVVKVKSPAQAESVHQNDYDVVIVYAATGSGELLKACFAQKKDRDTIVFVRHRSGPTYYWYEALSTRYLRTGDNTPRTGRLDHGGVHVEDVVVDDYDELLWRLRALYALKNLIGARIVALGGPWGKYSPEAPRVAVDKYGINIIDVPYDDIAARINKARADRTLVARAAAHADHYLSLPQTYLMTDRQYVVNAFLLHQVFKTLMREHDAPAFTIKNCMTKILPLAQTTPCLTLSLLNDEGLMAFCESDFVVIPAGILLHYISGTPVFLHNSTFPHKAICTCAHCSAPRRLDGSRYEPAKIMTHYESEYGAAPKVQMPVGREVTFVDPEYSTGRWVAFKGIVKSNPLYEICRSQQDVEIQGDWKKLLNEVRDSHWMMAYGDHLKPLGYAARKLAIDLLDISRA